MAFVDNIRRQYNYLQTYNFNKNINQYFISGIYKFDRPHNYDLPQYFEFKGIYNNGTAVGVIDTHGVSSTSDVKCSANRFTIDFAYGTDSTLNAVIIYPAKYGDVTIS